MKFGSRKICVVCALVLSTAFVCKANIVYSFNIFNNTSWASDSRLNFTVTISDEGQDKVGFLFENFSSINSSITDIYFDDDDLLERVESILSGSGVSFSAGASPKSLPGGTELTPKFDKKPEYSADSDSPVSRNGINPDEWLKITFTLETGENFDDVIEEISESDSRIGIHIQALPNGDSVSAINRITAVPEPTTIGLLTLGGLVFIIKKR